MSFQVTILLTDIYISSMSIKHYQQMNRYSRSISKHYANLIPDTMERVLIFCWFGLVLIFVSFCFFAWNKSLFQEKELGFDTCYFHHLKCSHTDLWLFHLYNNQFKHTFDSVAVSALWKVLKMRKSESHILTEA